MESGMAKDRRWYKWLGSNTVKVWSVDLSKVTG